MWERKRRENPNDPSISNYWVPMKGQIDGTVGPTFTGIHPGWSYNAIKRKTWTDCPVGPKKTIAPDHERLRGSWKICSLAVNGQSFLVIGGYLLNL